MQPVTSMFDTFPRLRALVPAAWAPAPAKAPASPSKAEEREAVRRWEDEGGNVL